MKQIYLAGSFSRLDEIKEHAQELREKGYMVDCRWLQGLHQVHQGAEKVESAKDSMPLEALHFAVDDIEDLQKAAWYLEKLINIELEKETMLVTLKPGTQPTSLETQGQHYHIGREG